MSVDLERVASVAAREVERQIKVVAERPAATECLLIAHASVLESAHRLPTLDDVRWLGAMIEPDKARTFRVGPAVFPSGGTANDHELIVPNLTRMFDLLDADTDTDQFVKAFLDVHPFRDGNGRTAWVLYNWLRGTLGQPDPLPDYYGGNP